MPTRICAHKDFRLVYRLFHPCQAQLFLEDLNTNLYFIYLNDLRVVVDGDMNTLISIDFMMGISTEVLITAAGYNLFSGLPDTSNFTVKEVEEDECVERI